MPKVLIPIPSTDFDPTEVAVTWKILIQNGIEVVFATPDGKAGTGDLRMLTGLGLGIWAGLLKADANAKNSYDAMISFPAFCHPERWDQVRASDFQGLVLPGGHAPGMKPYLESQILKKLIADFFAEKKVIGAICHGVLLAARSKREDGKSVLRDFRCTALLKSQELTAWAMTCLWLKNYYRTYPETVESEVTRNLAKVQQFVKGRLPLKRDSFENLENGFVVEDQNLISARWPGDAHLFGKTLANRLKK